MPADPLHAEIRARYLAGESINEVARNLMIGRARIRTAVEDIRRPSQHHPIDPASRAEEADRG